MHFVSNSLRLQAGVRKESTWRFMGNYKWSYKRVAILITHIRGLITPPIATLEPPRAATIETRPLLACCAQNMGPLFWGRFKLFEVHIFIQATPQKHRKTDAPQDPKPHQILNP